MWGEQKLLRKRDKLIQKLITITPIPAAEIDELRSCKGAKLKRRIRDAEKLYAEVLEPITAKTKVIAKHTNERNKLKKRQGEILRQKEQISQEIYALEESSQEYTEHLERLQDLINDERSLPPIIARYDNEINAAKDAKTVLEIVLIEESIKRTATNQEDTRTLDARIARLKTADKTNEKIRDDLKEFANEVNEIAETESSTLEAEKFLAERRREKQSTPTINKSQAFRTDTGEKSTPIPLIEDSEH